MAGKVVWDDEPAVKGVVWDDAPATPATPKKPAPTTARTALIAATQGATADFGDELGGLLGQFFLPERVKLGRGAQPAAGDSPILAAMKRQALAQEQAAPSDYRIVRDLLRQEATDAREANPGVYIPAEVAGATLSMLIPGAGAAKAATLPQMLGRAGAYGLATGVGGSEADILSGRPQSLADLGRDAAMGIGSGMAAGLLGTGLQKLAGAAGRKLASAGASRLAKAEAKAAQMAADATEAEIASARSAAGRTAQDAYKQLEHLRELGAVRNLAPEEKAVFDRLTAELAGKAQGKLLPAAAEKESAAALLSELTQNRAQTEAGRAAELLQSSVGPDLKGLFKSYGEPVVGALAGSYLGDEFFNSPRVGMSLGTVLGLITGRTRAGKAILTRLARPGNQAAMARAQNSLAALLGGIDGATATAIGRAEAPRLVGGMMPPTPLPALGQMPGGLDGAAASILKMDPEMAEAVLDLLSGAGQTRRGRRGDAP